MWILGLALLTLAVGVGARFTLCALRIALRENQEAQRRLVWPPPVRACEWPELQLDAVFYDPEVDDRVLLDAYWPAHPGVRSYLTVDLLDPAPTTRVLLHRWCVAHERLSPTELDGTFVLRRPRSEDAVSARIVAETVRRPDDGC